MHTDVAPDRETAHELLDRLKPEQITTIIALLQFMLADPMSRALACAPIDDEPETEDEREAVREADAWFAQHEAGIAHDEVKRQLGIRVKTQIEWSGQALYYRVRFVGGKDMIRIQRVLHRGKAYR